MNTWRATLVAAWVLIFGYSIPANTQNIDNNYDNSEITQYYSGK